MSHVIQRDPEDADDFYVWQDGITLGPHAEVIAGPDESVAFSDGTTVLAVIGSGRTVLTKETHPTLAHYLERHLLSAQPELAVCFANVSPSPGWEIDAELGRMPSPDGRVGTMACWASLTLQVSDVALFATKLVRMEEALLAAEDAADAEDAATDEAPYDDTIDETDGEEAEEEEFAEPNAVDFFLDKAVTQAVRQILVEDHPVDVGINAAVLERLANLVSAELEQFGLVVVQVDEVEMSRDGIAIE